MGRNSGSLVLLRCVRTEPIRRRVEHRKLMQLILQVLHYRCQSITAAGRVVSQDRKFGVKTRNVTVQSSRLEQATICRGL